MGCGQSDERRARKGGECRDATWVRAEKASFFTRGEGGRPLGRFEVWRRLMSRGPGLLYFQIQTDTTGRVESISQLLTARSLTFP